MPKYINAEMSYLQLTSSMEQSPAWKADSSLASQEISEIYGTWKFITALTRVSRFLCWNTLVHVLPNDFLETHFNIIL